MVDGHLRGITLPTTLLRLAARLVPRGDINIYLLADPDTLTRRKGELSVPEAEQQVEAYRTLAAEDPRSVILDSSALAPIEVAKRIAEKMMVLRA